METPVYLDYNATTPISREVIEEMQPYIEKYYGNPSSSYLFGKQNKEAIERARKQVADLINCNPDDIIFTSGGTESNNHAIKGIAHSLKHKGKHIITSAVEHPAITEVCKYLYTIGFDITYVKVDRYGMVAPADVEKAIRPDTILISIMHANNEVGTIQPIEQIGAIAKQNSIVFHTDAAQSVGKIATDVNELGVDLLTIAGHKLYAPKGIGALYIKKDLFLSNLMHGANQEKSLRPGTENVIEIVGLGKACEIANHGLSKNHNHMEEMRDRLYNGLKDRAGENIKVNGSTEQRLPNTLSIAFKDVEAHALAEASENDILISSGSACHSNLTEISQVLKAMNTDLDTARGTVRISTGKNTTKEEIDFAIETISNAVKEIV
jgi:cysteine desulfurase